MEPAGRAAPQRDELRKAGQVALRDTHATSLQHQVVILTAYHNDLSAGGKHTEATELRPKLSAMLRSQSTTAAFDNERGICVDRFRASEACWVLQSCRHLLHTRCLKRSVRAPNFR